jgi:FtsH-binding integral membrane protein
MTLRFRWLALGLVIAGMAVLAVVATASVSNPLLRLAIAGAVLVLLLPLAAYFVLSRRTHR